MRRAIYFAVATCCLSASLDADTLRPSDDTNINLAVATQNNGANASVFVRNVGAGGVRQAFVRFDVSSLDAAHPVGRAVLRVFVASLDNAGLIDVLPVLDPWAEATLTAGTVPLPGLGPAQATFAVATAQRSKYVEVEVTSLVQDWLDGTLPNHGLALLPSTVDNVRVDFDSKENGATSHPMELEVISAADITGVNAGLGLSNGGTSGDVTINLKTTCLPGNILKWNGGDWLCDLDLSGVGGTVTSIGSGLGLLGGPITTSGTLGLDVGFTDSRYSLFGHNHDASYVFKSGDTLTGALNLPVDGLVAGTNQFVLAGGRVGIGTTTPHPLSKLHVVGGDAIFMQSTEHAAMGIIGGLAGGDVQVNFYRGDLPGLKWRLQMPSFTNDLQILDDVSQIQVMYFKPGGNVGVGTAVPSQKLDVAGNLKISGGGSGLIFPDDTVQTTAATSSGGSVLSVGSGIGLIGGPITTAGTLSLDTGFTDSLYSPFGHNHDASYTRKSGDTMTGTLNLPANGLVAGTDQLVLSGGNVGIGTNPSNFRLHVMANAGPSQHLMAIQGGAFGSVNSGGIAFLDAAGTPMGTVGDGSQGNSHIYLGAELGNLILYTGATNALVVDSSQRVGIGTDVPTTRLDVGGDVRSTGQFLSAAAPGTPPLSVASTTHVPNLNADLLDGLDAAAFAPAGALGAFVARSGDSMTGALVLPADGLAAGTDQLVLASGNVGIGTPAPSQKLEVAGNVRISGGGNGLTFPDGTTQTTAAAASAETVVILDDDFDTGFLATAYWTASFVGNGSLSFNPGYVRLDNSSSSGGDRATIRSNKQFSLGDGTLIFKASLDAYHDSTIYGDFQPRGLANGTDRNDAIEFVSASTTSVACRTVAGGVVTQTVVGIGMSVYAAYSSYQIVASPSVVKFYVNGDLAATHTSNIPTTPLNVLFTTYDGGFGTTPIDVNRATFEIRR